MREKVLLSMALFALAIGVGVFAFTISLPDPSKGVLISSGCCALIGAISTFWRQQIIGRIQTGKVPVIVGLTRGLGERWDPHID